MHGPDGPKKARHRGHGDLRESSRIAVMIPIRVEIPPSSREPGSAGVPGALLNIGRSGGRVRVRWEFPLHARLFIALPVGMPSLRLPAEVIWARASFDLGAEPAEYGVRWGELLSSAVLEKILRRPGLTGKREAPHALGT
jgi:hypothetical protein